MSAPPIVTEMMSETATVVQGQRVSFVCSARGYPPPLISWYLDDMELQQGDSNIQITPSTSQDGYYNVTTSHLEIEAVETHMRGKLKCLARIEDTEIDLPSDERTIQIDVLGELDYKDNKQLTMFY